MLLFEKQSAKLWEYAYEKENDIQRSQGVSQTYVMWRLDTVVEKESNTMASRLGHEVFCTREFQKQ